MIEIIIRDNVAFLLPTAPQFYLGSADWFNQLADNEPDVIFPAVLMDNTIPKTTVIKPSSVEITYKVHLFFLHSYAANDEEGLDHEPQIGSERHTQVTAMNNFAINLLQILAKDTRIFKPLDNIQAGEIREVYNFMDANLDGVELPLSIKLTFARNCVDEHSGAPVLIPPVGQPAPQYQFLKAGAADEGLTAELQPVTDNNGGESPLQLSTGAVGIGAYADVETTLDNTAEELQNVHDELVTINAELDLKLDASAYNDRYKGRYASLVDLSNAYPVGASGDYAVIDAGTEDPARQALWDEDVNEWVLGSDLSPATTDQVPEGATNFYHTAERVRNVVLTGLSFLVGTAINAADTVLAALGKLQKQITDVKAATPGVHFVGGERLFTNSLAARSISSQAVVAVNVIRAWPFIVGKPLTITELHTSVTVGVGGGLMCVGVYSDNGNVYPDELLMFAEFNATAAEVGQVLSSPVDNVLLPPGLYWVAAYSNLASISNRAVITDAIPAVLGVTNLAINGAQGTAYTAGRAYDGALPANFPAGAAILANTQALAIGLLTS